MRQRDDDVTLAQGTVLLLLFNTLVGIALLFLSVLWEPAVVVVREYIDVTRFPRDSRLMINLGWPFFTAGIYQWIYVIPLCFYCWRRRQFASMKAIIVGAVITVLLSSGCFIIVGAPNIFTNK